MNAVPILSKQRDILTQLASYRNRHTLVVDLENTFITKVDIKNRNELDCIQNKANFSTDYILLEV